MIIKIELNKFKNNKIPEGFLLKFMEEEGEIKDGVQIVDILVEPDLE